MNPFLPRATRVILRANEVSASFRAGRALLPRAQRAALTAHAVAYIVGITMTALGEFEVLVLMAVLRLGDGAYAPAIRDEIEARTQRSVARGAVYVTLDRLEAKRLLGSALEESAERGGRARRFYRVAPKGLRAVKRALSAVEQMRAGLEPLLDKP